MQPELAVRDGLRRFDHPDPDSLLSTITVRRANSLPREIWPLVPTCLITCFGAFMQEQLSCY